MSPADQDLLGDADLVVEAAQGELAAEDADRARDGAGLGHDRVAAPSRCSSRPTRPGRPWRRPRGFSVLRQLDLAPDDVGGGAGAARAVHAQHDGADACRPRAPRLSARGHRVRARDLPAERPRPGSRRRRSRPRRRRARSAAGRSNPKPATRRLGVPAGGDALRVLQPVAQLVRVEQLVHQPGRRAPSSRRRARRPRWPAPPRAFLPRACADGPRRTRRRCCRAARPSARGAAR